MHHPTAAMPIVSLPLAQTFGTDSVQVLDMMRAASAFGEDSEMAAANVAQ